MKKPLVSIIIPAYNSEKYIHHLFESLLIQTNKDFEVIVINDGSTDKTEDVLKKYKQTFLSLNIQFEYINKANAGLGSAINDGLKKVRGEYFCWADSDDFYVNNFFEKMLNFFKKHPNCMFVRGDAYILPNAKINDYNLNELKRKSDYNIDIYKKNLFLNDD